MAYQTPQFNLLASIWDCRFPTDGGADWTMVPCQKYILSRMSLDVTPPTQAGWWERHTPPIQLRFPITHAAFFGPPAEWEHLCFEVPEGSGQYYRTQFSEIQHQGFPNEYAIILATPCNDSGLSIPPPSADTPVGVAPDVCLIPPEEDWLRLVGEWIVDSNTTDRFGYVARVQDAQNYYAAMYHGTDGGFEIRKVVASVITVLAFEAFTTRPPHNGTVDIRFDVDGDSLLARFTTDYQDVILTVTDTSLPTGDDHGLIARSGSSPACNNFFAYVMPGFVTGAQDVFSDTAGVDLAAHTMNAGSGWVYVGTATDWAIDVSGNAVIATGFYAPTNYAIAVTDVPL